METAFEIVANLATAASVLVAVGVLVAESRRNRDEAVAERHRRERAAFATLDEGYRRYLELCIDTASPDTLEIDPATLASIGVCTEDERRRFALHMYVISLVESAFVLLDVRRLDGGEWGVAEAEHIAQWRGWAEFFEGFAARPDFRASWGAAGRTSEAGFSEWADALVQAHSSTAVRDGA